MNLSRLLAPVGFLSLSALPLGAWGQTSKAPATAPAPAATAPAATAPAPAQTFEELRKDALPAKDLATLIEPLYARCEDGDELHRRQCEGQKAYLLEYLHDHAFVADSDVPPETSPYDSVAKQVDMEVPGCVACVAVPTVAGEPRFLTMKAPQRVVNGKAQVVPVASHEIALPDRVLADRFVERVVPRLRVEHVFKFGVPFGDTPPPATGSGKLGGAQAAPAAPLPKGVLLTSLGHRVYDRCTGEVTAAVPPSTGKVAVKPDKTCPKKGGVELSAAELRKNAEIAALPERLTPHEIDRTLAPVQARMHECYVEFGEPSGIAKVQVTIGGEGKLTGVTLPSPFDKADIGLCMRAQLKSATFPKFRGSAMTVDYVYQVN